MRIELLTHGRHRTHAGIGRYVHTLLQHLGPLADVDLCQLWGCGRNQGDCDRTGSGMAG
jgi:hypothetical protein